MVGYAPRTQAVADFHNSPARFRIISAPARTSKSYSAAYDVLEAVFPDYEEAEDGKHYPVPLPTGDRHLWIVGPDYKTIKEWDYLWRELVSRGNHNGLRALYRYTIETKANSPQQGNMRLVLSFGKSRTGEDVRTVITGKSATNPESLQGEQVHVALLSEAAELDAVIWERYLSTRCRHVIAPTTPKLKAAWLKKLIDDGAADPSLSIESFHFDGKANPHYDWELFKIERKKAASRVVSGRADDDPWFAEQFLGSWTGEDERAIPFYEKPLAAHPGHVRDALPAWFAGSKTFVSVDYGFDDAAVALFWAIGPHDQLAIFAEVYERKMTTQRFVELVLAKCRALGVRPSYFTGDPKQPQIAAIYAERGIAVFPMDKRAQADRAAGGQMLVDALSVNPATGEPGLVVVSERAGEGFGAPFVIREWNNLRRKRGTAAGEWSTGAIVGADHAFDAARYGIMTRPKPAPPPTAKSWFKEWERRQRSKPVSWHPQPLVGAGVRATHAA